MKKQRKPPLNIRLLKKINNDVQYIKNELPKMNTQTNTVYSNSQLTQIIESLQSIQSITLTKYNLELSVNSSNFLNCYYIYNNSNIKFTNMTNITNTTNSSKLPQRYIYLVFELNQLGVTQGSCSFSIQNNMSSTPIKAHVLLIGGGGTGGVNNSSYTCGCETETESGGGGGGGGGILYKGDFLLSATNEITIGSGASIFYNNGNNSSINNSYNTVTSLGGYSGVSNVSEIGIPHTSNNGNGGGGNASTIPSYGEIITGNGNGGNNNNVKGQPGYNGSIRPFPDNFTYILGNGGGAGTYAGNILRSGSGGGGSNGNLGGLGVLYNNNDINPSGGGGGLINVKGGSPGNTNNIYPTNASYESSLSYCKSGNGYYMSSSTGNTTFAYGNGTGGLGNISNNTNFNIETDSPTCYSAGALIIYFEVP